MIGTVINRKEIMFFSAGISVLVCGFISVLSLYSKLRPNAKNVQRIIVIFQGWFGFLVCLWGIFSIIVSIVPNIRWLTSGWILYWITFIFTGICNCFSGFLLGFGLIEQIGISKAGEAYSEKALEIRGPLVAVQVVFGFICLGTGAWAIIFETMSLRF